MAKITQEDVVEGLKLRLDTYDNGDISREHFEKNLAKYILDLIALAKLKEKEQINENQAE